MQDPHSLQVCPHGGLSVGALANPGLLYKKVSLDAYNFLVLSSIWSQFQYYCNYNIITKVDSGILPVGYQWYLNLPSQACSIAVLCIYQRVETKTPPLELHDYFESVIHGSDCLSYCVIVSIQPSKELKALSYDDLLREILDDEKQYIRHLNLILMVFMEPFLNKDLFPDAVRTRLACLINILGSLLSW